MNDERSSRALFILPLLLILGFDESHAQLSSNTCTSTALNCSQCVPTAETVPPARAVGLPIGTAVGRIPYTCTCCPTDYSCCTSGGLAVCCPVSTGICTRDGCALTTNPIPSTSICSTCGPMYLSIVADNHINQMYIDGVPYVTSTGSDWPNVETFKIPAGSKVIAVKASNNGSVAGLLASTTNGFLMTSSAWKCTTQFYANWMQPTYVDTWPNAVVSFPNTGVDILHGNKPQITNTAGWIWTSKWRWPSDTPVYCRGYFPTSSCQLRYGECSNLCPTKSSECCGCSLSGGGDSTSMTCNCCPRKYQCCTNSNGLTTCCSPRSVCQDGRCVRVMYAGPPCSYCSFSGNPSIPTA